MLDFTKRRCGREGTAASMRELLQDALQRAVRRGDTRRARMFNRILLRHPA